MSARVGPIVGGVGVGVDGWMGEGYGRGTHTRVSEAVSLQVVTLNKSHVTHGTSIRLHPYTHRAMY